MGLVVVGEFVGPGVVVSGRVWIGSWREEVVG